MEQRLSAEQLQRVLAEHFAPAVVTVHDNSRQHAGHGQARGGGGGHFAVCLVAEQFAGMPLLQRHRLVHTALKKHLGQGIHALSLQAFTPHEWACRA
jgi:BolA protein